MPIILQNEKRYSPVISDDIKALPTVATASGSVASFDTDMQENLIEVVCDIQYQQASGTPTPQSPIPITVYNSLNLSHSGSDTSNPTITNIPFGQTVAKGTLNVSTGVLEIEKLANSISNMNFSFDYYANASATITGMISGQSQVLPAITSECFETVIYNNRLQYTNPIITLVNYQNQIQIRNHGSATISDFITTYGNYIIVYKLETPITIQLDSNTITALLNENNIWCDTNGNTSVKYILSVGKKIS